MLNIIVLNDMINEVCHFQKNQKRDQASLMPDKLNHTPVHVHEILIREKPIANKKDLELFQK